MADLIQDFFRRDLTDAEMDKLESTLQNETEALRFAEKAEGFYTGLGLPFPSASRFGWKSLLWPTVVVGTVLIFWPLVRDYLGERPMPVQKPVIEKVAPVILPVVQPKVEPVVKATPAKKPMPTMEPKINFEGLSGVQVASKQFDGLSVVVALPDGQIVTARVMDEATNEEVQLIYAGFLDAGEWRFRWGGEDMRGEKVTFGRYAIQVEASGIVKRQVVEVGR